MKRVLIGLLLVGGFYLFALSWTDYFQPGKATWGFTCWLLALALHKSQWSPPSPSRRMMLRCAAIAVSLLFLLGASLLGYRMLTKPKPDTLTLEDLLRDEPETDPDTLTLEDLLRDEPETVGALQRKEEDADRVTADALANHDKLIAQGVEVIGTLNTLDGVVNPSPKQATGIIKIVVLTRELARRIRFADPNSAVADTLEHKATLLLERTRALERAQVPVN